MRPHGIPPCRSSSLPHQLSCFLHLTCLFHCDISITVLLVATYRRTSSRLALTTVPWSVAPQPSQMHANGVISHSVKSILKTRSTLPVLRKSSMSSHNRSFHPADKCSIIAVHGLNPRSKNAEDHAWDTWRTPSGKDGRLWLCDDLPQCVEKPRIFLYRYDATAVYGKDRDTFVGKASELLEAIRVEREHAETRPILFLGHSMGGLLIKQALINAHNNPKYKSIKKATSGISFFATPHSGGDWKLVSLGSLAAKLAELAGFKKGEGVMETLEQGSIFSEIMDEHWRHQLQRYDFVSFWGAHDGVSCTVSVSASC